MCGCYYCRDGGFYKLCMRIDAEYKWNAIAYFPTNENVRAYKDLMPIWVMIHIFIQLCSCSLWQGLFGREFECCSTM